MSKESLKERLRNKQKDLKSRGTGGNMYYLKADTTVRVRILNMGEEEEFVKEVIQFYLGGEIKGVISPATFNEPCAIYEAYQNLKASEDNEEKEMAKMFNIRQRYLALCLIYKDLKGKELEDNPVKFVLLTSSMYQSIIEYYLDEDDWGDMSQPGPEGYDLKLKRTGSGITDTEYHVSPCSKTPLPKAYLKKVFNLDEEVRKIMPTYEETKELLSKFLGDDISNEKPKEEKKKKRLIRKKKDLG